MAKPTTEKKGLNPPDVNICEMTCNLSKYVKSYLKLSEFTRKICEKYAIYADAKSVWSLDNIRKAWGKTQWMKKGEKKLQWTLVALSQLRRRSEIIRNTEADSRKVNRIKWLLW